MMIVEVSLSILWTVPLNRSSFVEVFFWSCALAMTARDSRRNTPTNHAIKLFMRIKFRSFPGYPCAPYPKMTPSCIGSVIPLISEQKPIIPPKVYPPGAGVPGKLKKDRREAVLLFCGLRCYEAGVFRCGRIRGLRSRICQDM